MGGESLLNILYLRKSIDFIGFKAKRDASIFLKEIINEHKNSGGSILVSSHIDFLDNADIKINLDNKNVSF